MSKTTIYYDGGCPLCRAEIAQYERLDRDGKLALVDVTDANGALPDNTDRATALGRFHVTSAEGHVLSGAAAFVAVWGDLPGWRWHARVARLPGVTPLLELAYRGFLPLRPVFVRAFVALKRRRS